MLFHYGNYDTGMGTRIFVAVFDEKNQILQVKNVYFYMEGLKFTILWVDVSGLTFVWVDIFGLTFSRGIICAASA